MEFLVKHLSQVVRRYPSGAQVGTIGFLPAKTERIGHKFNSYNFSFILEGKGTYMHRGRYLRVRPPCVITQYMDEPMDYGPDESWQEVFLIYPPEAGDYLKAMKFMRKSKVLWNIKNTDLVFKLINELKSALKAPIIDADRVDRICERMVLESLLGFEKNFESEEEKKIKAVENYLINNFSNSNDFDLIAKEQGMSLSTFRRYWLKYIGVPPAKYIDNLIISEACKLLVESSKGIKEIAEALNFDDCFYFSKKFHKRMGVTPTQYRKQHRQF